MSARQQRVLQAFMRTAPSSSHFEEFFKLLWSRDSDLGAWPSKNVLVRLSGLLSSFVSEPGATEIPRAYTDAITEHPVYKWLSSSEAFARARQVFASRDEADWRKRELGDLAFLEALTLSTWTAVTHGNDWKPATVSTEQRKRAVANAQELLDYVKRDLRTRNSIELQNVVGRFRAELQLHLRSKIRDYSGPDARERYLCVRLGELLASIHGLKNDKAVSILNHFAELCGLTIGARSAQRYMAIARSNRGLPKLRADKAKKPAPRK